MSYGIVFFLLNYFFDEIASNKTFLKIYYLLYTLLEYFFFSYILYIKIKSSVFKKLIFACSILFFVFASLYYLFYKYKTLDSIPIGIETILIFIYIVYYFNEVFRDSKTNIIYTNYTFWILVGLMIYLGGSFFFNILANHLNPKELLEYWTLTFLADIIKNILLAISIFICAHYPEKNKESSSSLSIPNLDMV